MPRLFHSNNQHLCFWINHRLTFVHAGEFSDAIYGIEAEKCNELDFETVLTNEQLRADLREIDLHITVTM